jgi:hypothetical protein
MSEYDDLKRRIEELEAEKLKGGEQLPQYMSHIKRPVEAEDKPKVQKYDPTEGFRLPPSAAKAMARVVPDDPKPQPGFNRHAWEQNKGPGEPGGFGSPQRPGPTTKPVERGTGWIDPMPLEGRVNEAEIKKRWSP